jgi:uncharacterized protein involved in cysteine biosynthesis
MKHIAEFIRKLTPNWTDKDRYNWLSTLHSWLIPLCLISFIFINNWIVRSFILVMQTITVVTEFFFKDCLITMVEKEFSSETWDDLAEKLFKNLGWKLRRKEKMAFNIGINVGVLLVFILLLLKESLLWMVGFAGISLSTVFVFILKGKEI